MGSNSEARARPLGYMSLPHHGTTAGARVVGEDWLERALSHMRCTTAAPRKHRLDVLRLNALQQSLTRVVQQVKNVLEAFAAAVVRVGDGVGIVLAAERRHGVESIRTIVRDVAAVALPVLRGGLHAPRRVIPCKRAWQ